MNFFFCFTDQDECLTERGGCTERADCINTEGSYYCQCKVGYSGDGTTCEGVYDKKNLTTN